MQQGRHREQSNRRTGDIKQENRRHQTGEQELSLFSPVYYFS
jgi:hypothetical protein